MRWRLCGGELFMLSVKIWVGLVRISVVEDCEGWKMLLVMGGFMFYL